MSLVTKASLSLSGGFSFMIGYDDVSQISHPSVNHEYRIICKGNGPNVKHFKIRNVTYLVIYVHCPHKKYEDIIHYVGIHTTISAEF